MLKPWTLSDGTVLPQGTYVSASFAAHFDEEEYQDPYKFNPWRHMRDTKARVNNLMTTTSANFMAFGHGAHACVSGPDRDEQM